MPPMASNAIDGKWKAPSGVRLAPSSGFSSHRQRSSIGGIDVERSNFDLQQAIAAAPKSGTIGIPPSPSPRAALLANLRTAPRANQGGPPESPQKSPPQKSPPTPRSPPTVSALHMAALSAFARNARNNETNGSAAGRSKAAPRPLNLSDSKPVGGGNVPHSAMLPPKTAQRLGLTPRTATFPAQQYMQMMQQQQKSPQFAAAMYAQQQAAYQTFAMPQTPSTPLLVLSQPDEYGDIVPGTPAPYVLPADQVYNNIAIGYDAEGPFYYHYDYEVEYTPPTPTAGTMHMRHKSADARSQQQRPSVMHSRSLSSTSSNGGAERRKSRLDPDAILPMRQPRGPDLAKNFATRIRRRNIKTILSAAAERRNGVRGEGAPATPLTPTIKIDESELNTEAPTPVVEGLSVSSPSSDSRRRSAIF